MSRWHDHLVEPTFAGQSVVAAGPEDEGRIAALFTCYVDATALAGRCPDGPSLAVWIRALLSSHLWLVLLLQSPRGPAQGFAICQYAAYEVDPERRILKCRHLYVDSSETVSLRASAGVLLSAVVEAARRSPQLVDVFLITFGAHRLDALRRACERRGFRCIGTQHVGLRPQLGTRLLPPALPPGVFLVQGPDALSAAHRAQLESMAQSFFLESARPTLGPFAPNLDRLIAAALRTVWHEGTACLLAMRSDRLVGFIAAAPGWLAPFDIRLLQSTFFYVDPLFRGGRVGLALFEGLSRVASSMGFEGVYLGTSGEIQTQRTRQLLSLRGYAHRADVMALRVRPISGGGQG